MVARLIARLPAVVVSKTYGDDPLSFRSLRKSGTIAAREPELLGHAAQNPLLVYMYEALALELEHDQEGAGADGDLAGPGRASSCLTGGARPDKVARQTS
jgi:hypothetical protein